MASKKMRVLFLCTGNSCRSQMAEGWLRELYGDGTEALSAGANPSGYVHDKAIAAMKEVGIDISHHTSQHVNDFLPPDGELPDLIISVCATADRNCPVFPAGVKRLRWAFDDPGFAEGDDAQQMNEFRRVRDEIRGRLDEEFGDDSMR